MIHIALILQIVIFFQIASKKLTSAVPSVSQQNRGFHNLQFEFLPETLAGMEVNFLDPKKLPM